MAFTRGRVVVAFTLSMSPVCLFAHELWLEPKRSLVQSGDEVSVSIRIGENLIGDEIPNLPDLQEAVDLTVGSDRFSVSARVGDIPAFSFEAQEDALLVLRYQSTPNFLTYESADDFIKFLDEAQRSDIKDAWEGSYVEGSKITEVFTRFAKTIIGIGDAEGSDVSLGMPFELVMLENPFSENFDGSLSYKVLRNGQPASEAPYHVFYRNIEGNVTRIEGRADSDGFLEVEARNAGFYLVNAIDLAEASQAFKAQFGAQWQSDWASSSFHLPK